MNMLTTTIARWIFALSVGILGINHFVNASSLVQYVPGFIPGGIFWVYLTGLAFLAACISMLSGLYMRLACLLLALMFAIFVITIHIPSTIGKSLSSITAVANDLALAAGALFLAGISENNTISNYMPTTMTKTGDSDTKHKNYENVI